MPPAHQPRLSLAQRAYRDIKEQILTSRLRPGDLVAAHTFAEKYGMSRSPVAQALTLLMQEGLVRGVPRVGYVISPVTVTDVHEIFQLRLQLEGLAAELAARKATGEDVDRFTETDRQVRALAQSLSPDDPSFIRHSIDTHSRFHLMVAQLSGNRRLIEFIGRLLDDSQRIQSLDPRFRYHIAFLAGAHRDVVHGLAAGDADLARNAMEEHIRLGQQRLINSLLLDPNAFPSADDGASSGQRHPADHRR